MNAKSLRVLTWGTLLAALIGAMLLATEDSGLPDPSPFGDDFPNWASPTPAAHRRAAPVPGGHRTRDVGARRRER